MRKIYGRGFFVWTIFLLFLAFSSAGAKFLLTLCLGRIIDAVSGGWGETLRYFVWIAAMLFFFILASGWMTLCGRRLAARFGYRLRVRVGEKICTARYLEIEGMKEGELLTAATKDGESLKEWLLLLSRVGTIPAQLALTLAFAFWYHWKYALFTVALIPLAAIPEVLIAKRLSLCHCSEKRAYSQNTSFFTESLELITVIKSFCLEKLWQEKNEEFLDVHRRAKVKRMWREQQVDVYSRCFNWISSPLLLILGAWFIISGEMSLGMMASIMLLTGFVGEGISLICEIPVKYQNARAGMDHIETLLRIPGERKGRMPKSDEGQQAQPIYELRSLNFEYGGKQVLFDISCSFERGEKVAVVGPSGSGKTTLFKLLSGLYTPRRDQAFFRGEDLSQIDPGYLRENVTVSAQESFLFHASFRDNIRVSCPGGSDEDIMRAGKNARIDDFIRTRERGYETTVRSVSNGQMQRINLARAFMRHTEVFLFDEPTSALDPETSGQIFQYLFSRYEDKTVLMILHDFGEIGRFDRVLMMDKGRIAGFDTHEELLAGCPAYRLLYYGKGSEEDGE